LLARKFDFIPVESAVSHPPRRAKFRISKDVVHEFPGGVIGAVLTFSWELTAITWP
jgi:hypothetical protein